jgi:hypothetical protein
MDIATGQRPSVVEVDPREIGLEDDSGPLAVTVRPLRYLTGQGVPSDATPQEAKVAQPNRVFTVTKIEEPVEEAFYEEPDDDTSDQEPYPAERADDERHPGGNWMEDVFE